MAAPDPEARLLDADSAADDLPEETTATIDGPRVEDNRGQVATHVDQMNQTINYWLSRYRAALELSADHVRLTMETFVERDYRRTGAAAGPMTSRGASRLLVEHRFLILIGAADSGRRSAAVALLARTGLPLHLLPVDDDACRLLPVGEFAWPRSGKPTACLIVVPPTAERHGRLPEQLSAYRAEADRHAGHLVVLMDRDTWQAVESVPGYVAVQVGRPNPHEMLRTLLRDQEQRWDTGRFLQEKRVTSAAPH
ncbi:hypothetical protein ACFOZ6_12670 [Actinoplanes siamensis]